MTEKDNSGFIERFTIRLPDGMRDAIAEKAKQNGRSMNSEIIAILENSLNPASGSERNEVLMERLRAIEEVVSRLELKQQKDKE